MDIFPSKFDKEGNSDQVTRKQLEDLVFIERDVRKVQNLCLMTSLPSFRSFEFAISQRKGKNDGKKCDITYQREKEKMMGKSTIPY